MADEPTGRARGGKATAAKMSPEQLKERARKGSEARWGKKPAAPAPRMRTRSEALSIARSHAMVPKEATPMRFAPPALMGGVVPAGKASAIAMDYAPGVYEFANNLAWGGASFTPFPGYSYLSGLATRAEYRNFADGISSEMTREWIKFHGASQEDGQGQAAQDKERIKQLEDAVRKFNLQDLFKLATAQDCFFGRGQISINIRGAEPMLPLILSPRTIPKGSLDSFTCIEAIWTTPSAYNSNDPMAADFYKPREWFVLGKQVHASRIMSIITRPLPDIIKPAYNFSGMSLSQLAEPYVNNWLRTRQSVSDLINNFSITALKTDMAQVLQGGECGPDGSSDIFARADLFTLVKANKGLMLLDKDTEELDQLNTPLSGLHELQAQALEQLCTVSRIPAVILTGVSPSGLNASSEGEIRVFYDWISSQQEAYLRHPLETCIHVIMLHLWGEIDPTITFKFNPLWQLSGVEESTIRTNDANAAVALLDRGVVSAEEVRESLSNNPNSGFSGIDITAVPELDLGDPGLDASVSAAQHRAMEAAAAGKSTLGIPTSVGEEFVSKD